MRLSVVYSSDNDYAQHMGVSMLSLFENNKSFTQIQVYLIQNQLSQDNQNKLNRIVDQYGRKLNLIDFDVFSDKLKLNIGNSISVNSYARLFLSSVLEHEDQVLYLDCDSVINGSLLELWNTDIRDFDVAGVCDTAGSGTRLSIGMDPDTPYINAGMLLINLKRWRQRDLETKFLRFIDSHNGHVFHHDQGTINGVINNSKLLLHPKYNAMTTFFTMSRMEMLHYYQMKSFYSEFELKQAVNHPVFIHFTPAFVNRPWIKGCKHPLAHLYHQYLNMSPWRGGDLWEDRRSKGEKMIAFMYNHMPFRLANGISRLISK